MFYIWHIYCYPTLRLHVSKRMKRLMKTIKSIVPALLAGTLLSTVAHATPVSITFQITGGNFIEYSNTSNWVPSWNPNFLQVAPANFSETVQFDPMPTAQRVNLTDPSFREATYDHPVTIQGAGSAYAPLLTTLIGFQNLELVSGWDYANRYKLASNTAWGQYSSSLALFCHWNQQTTYGLAGVQESYQYQRCYYVNNLPVFPSFDSVAPWSSEEFLDDLAHLPSGSIQYQEYASHWIYDNSNNTMPLSESYVYNGTGNVVVTREVPEPATLTLLGIAAVALLGRRRISQQQFR